MVIRKSSLLILSVFFFFSLQGVVAAEDTRASKIDKIGVQLYTLRDEAKKDLENVLNQITLMGYEQVELHTLYDLSAGKLKLLLDKYRIDAYATHRSYSLIKEDIQGTLSDARILGLDYVIIPWLDIKEYNTKEKWEAFSQDLNRIGKIFKAHDVTLAYHNHAFEFEALADGSLPYDILLKNTDPKYVAMQLDLFWIIQAGKDPISYIENNSGRIISVHIKDMKKDGSMTEVGAGEIDFKKILKVARKHGLKYYIVEHDKPANAFESVKTSYDYLKTMELN